MTWSMTWNAILPVRDLHHGDSHVSLISCKTVALSVDTHLVYSLAATLKHLAHLRRQVPCMLTPAELLWCGGTLTVSNVGATGAGQSMIPVLVSGGGIVIDALGHAQWVWDVKWGDGKGEQGLKWALACQWTTASGTLLRVPTSLILPRHGAGTLNNRSG